MVRVRVGDMEGVRLGGVSVKRESKERVRVH